MSDGKTAVSYFAPRPPSLRELSFFIIPALRSAVRTAVHSSPNFDRRYSFDAFPFAEIAAKTNAAFSPILSKTESGAASALAE